jgi:tetratricopeptide (TPR) repeat protein
VLGSVIATLARRLRQRDQPSSNRRDDGARTGAAVDALQRGIEHALAGRHAEALPLLQVAADALPERPDAVEALANVNLFLGHHDAAIAGYRRVIEANPHADSAWGNLGLALRAEHRLDEAQAALERALGLKPGQAETRLTLALLQVDRGELAAAEAALRDLCSAYPDLVEAHTALSHVMLLQGHFEQGWKEYAWRLKLPEAQPDADLPFPRWDGTPMPGKHLLITAEQGLGDQIMLMSCVPDAAHAFDAVTLECDPRLERIAARSFPRVRTSHPGRGADSGRAQPQRLPDMQVRLGDLPGLCRRAFEDFPPHRGYLCADTARVAYWRSRLLASGSPPYIGISWRGGAARTRAAMRSIALEQWLPVLRATPGTYVNLQYGDCEPELDAVRAHGVGVVSFPDAIADYDETAALVAALDLVISVQTAVVHLAGALAKPAWVMVPVVPEWRYMAQGDRSPWYPSLRLFRQTQPDDWSDVIARIRSQLQAQGIAR